MPAFDLPLPELERYRPDIDEPADFDAFWRDTLKEPARRTRWCRCGRWTTGLRLIDTGT